MYIRRTDQRIDLRAQDQNHGDTSDLLENS